MPMLARRHFTWAAALIVLLATALRLHALSHVPPGLHFDEAANGLFVRDIAYGSYRPLFITAYTGKEVLWFYLAALVMRATGPEGAAGIFALRLTSAFIGTLTVATTGWLVLRLYPGDWRRGWLALFAMAVLATSFWHVVLSRLAFRAISQPLMQALSLGLLWRGLRGAGRRRLLWLALAGAMTGLAGYTYLAVRLFPVPIAIAALAVLASEPKRAAGRLADLLVYAAAALAAFAPLGVFFLRHPGTFGTRIGQVAPHSLNEMLAGWQAALRMLFIAGDPLARFNLPGRPLFGPVLGALLVIGLGAVLWEMFHARTSLDRARGALLAVWPFAMLAPTALATNVPYPSNLRAVGLAPLIALYPALGILKLAQKFGAGQHRRLVRAVLPVALMLVGGVGGSSTLLALDQWGHMPALYYENDGDVAALARYLNQVRQPEDTVYMATLHYEHPTLAFLTDAYSLENSIYEGEALVLAPAGNTLAAYVRTVPPPAEWAAWLDPYRQPTPPGPDGTPDFYAYRLPPTFDPGLPAVGPVNFGNIIQLEGAKLYPTISGGEAVADLAWRVLAAPVQPDYYFVAEVCDGWGRCWPRVGPDGQAAGGISQAVLSNRWQPGERMVVRLRVPLALGAPPGEYDVRVRIVSNTAPVLPVLSTTGAFAGLYASTGPLTVTPGTTPALDELSLQYLLEQAAAPGLTLLGYDLASPQVRPGERLGLTLYWLAGSVPRRELPVILWLGDAYTLYQGDPVHGTRPISVWQPGELVADHYSNRLPLDVAPGVYALRVQVGDYEPVILGRLQVMEATRRFDLPASVTRLDPPPELGGQVSLAGYGLSPGPFSPGDALPVALAWRSEAPAEIGYTVFVHLVDAGGQIIAQVDRPPQSGGEPYPTDLWLPGEVVIDTYRLSIPAGAPSGEYTIRVGLYLQENGQRLAIPGTSDDAFTLPATLRIR